ncbi:MAG: hypothetical protein WC080_01465 [Patescibacteria group bacterium]|jgi:hypothetical protein
MIIKPKIENPFGPAQGGQGSKISFQKGAYLPVIMVTSVLFLGLSMAVAGFALSNLKDAKLHMQTVSALDVAEAGVNYYMWHLAHDNKDYCDGNVCPQGDGPYGPYAHDYTDQSGNVVGTYDLYITPPGLGDAVVNVKAVGKIKGESMDRIVLADLGMPSFARYAFLTNTECWFGVNETTNGPVHSNVGVHFDGTANGIISSSSATYRPTSSFGGDGQLHDGVWGNGGPKNYWVFPVPTVDFNRVSVDFANLKTESKTGGIYLDSSKSRGYYLKLRSDGKIDEYRVSGERSTGITANFLGTLDAPGNGVVYVNDNVWVDGTYNGRITIAAYIDKSGPALIKIKDNLLYGAKDGTASIGLVSQGNIEIPDYAVSSLEIDAALLSQTGHVWYPDSKGPVKSSISIYGSISTNQYWTWSWVSGSTVIAGYRNTLQTYDPYLTLSPPPEYPTTGSYAILSWREE